MGSGKGRHAGTAVLSMGILAWVMISLLIVPFHQFITTDGALAAENLTTEPMDIRGNGQFLMEATLNDWPGSGTEGDPFIIEDRLFDLVYQGSGYYGSPALLIKDVSLHFVIRSCTFGHEKEEDEDYTWYVLMIYNSTHVTLEDNTIWGNIHRGLAVINSPSLKLKGIRVMEGSIILRSTSFENYTGYVLEDNLVKGKPYEFIFNRTGDTISGTSGKYTIAYSEDVTVKDLEVEDMDSAVELIHCTNSTVEGSEFLNCSVAGILTSGSTDCILRDNTFRDCGLNGILMEDTRDTLIERNTIRGSEEDGIYATGCRRNTILENEIEECLNAGIWLIEGDSSEIIGNQVSGCRGEGIMLEDSRGCSIDGNDCMNIKSPGIHLLGTSDTTVSRNNVAWDLWSDDYYDGIYLKDSLNNSINNNTVTGIPDAAILLRNSSSNSVKDNRMMGNDGAGIVADDGSTENLMAFNVMKDCESGILLSDGSYDNIIHHNDIINISEDDGYDTTGKNQWWDGVDEGNHWSDHLERYPESTTSDMITWNEDHSIDSGTSGSAKDPYPLIFPVNLEGEGFLDATREWGIGSGDEIYFMCMIKDSTGIDGPEVDIGLDDRNFSESSIDLTLDERGFFSALFTIPSNFAGWLTYSYRYSRDAREIVHGPFEVPVVDGEDPVADAGENIIVEGGIPFVLNGSRSTDNVGIVSFVWDMGYGYPDLEGEVVQYVIYREFSREITLTVYDEEGNSDRNRVYLKVLWESFEATVGPVLDAEAGEPLDGVRVQLQVESTFVEEWTGRNGICYLYLSHEFRGKTVNATFYKSGYDPVNLPLNFSREGEVETGEIYLGRIDEGKLGPDDNNGSGPVFALVLFILLLAAFTAIIYLSIRAIPRGALEGPLEGGDGSEISAPEADPRRPTGDRMVEKDP